jgi:hypothetical protein
MNAVKFGERRLTEMDSGRPVGLAQRLDETELAEGLHSSPCQARAVSLGRAALLVS